MRVFFRAGQAKIEERIHRPGTLLAFFLAISTQLNCKICTKSEKTCELITNRRKILSETFNFYSKFKPLKLGQTLSYHHCGTIHKFNCKL